MKYILVALLLTGCAQTHRDEYYLQGCFDGLLRIANVCEVYHIADSDCESNIQQECINMLEGDHEHP